MNIKKLLGLKIILRNTAGDGGDSGGALGMHDAGAAFAGMGDDGEQPEESEESTVERLAAEEAAGATQKTGDETAQGEDAYDENETVTVKIDGKTVELTKAQIAEAKKGELRQQDYTRKTMAAAETVKVAEAETAKARADRDNYASQLNNFAIATNSQIQEQQKLLTQELLDTDPIEYLRQERTLQQRQAEMGKAQAELQRLQGEYQQEQQQAAQEFLRNQHAKMVETFPEWKDPVKLKQHVAGLEDYMGKQGFNEQDGRMVLDARVMILADKAMKYEALLARAKESAGKVKAAPVIVERPGVVATKSTDGRTTAMKQLEKSGTVRDAGAVFANF